MHRLLSVKERSTAHPVLVRRSSRPDIFHEWILHIVEEARLQQPYPVMIDGTVTMARGCEVRR